MEDRLNFNEKLGSWLNAQRQNFENQNIQEALFEIIERVEEIGELTSDEKMLIKKISTGMMKLSFIINNNPSETGKLIQYLQ